LANGPAMKIGVSLLFVLFFASGYGQSITVVSYNIRLDTEADGVNQWKNRVQKVVSLIQKYDPDLLGVQEALHNQMLDLQKELPDYAFVGVGRDDGKEKGEYSAIFYKKDKFDTLTQQTIWLSKTPEVPGSKSWDAALTRIMTFTMLKDKATGKSFIHANTHFDHVGKEARMYSANMIKTYISGFVVGYTFEMQEKEIPLIVSGDFNSEPTEGPYQTMIDGNFLKLYDARPSNDLTGTFCGFELGKIPCRTLDYIFHSHHWKVLDYKVVDDHDGRHYPSDHLPVMVKLSLIP
jgi:endonuclease/exonuclease/phosphatase family metal-dependent hydrolase